MIFIPVEEIPKKRTPKAGEFVEYKSVHDYLKEFMKMDVKYAKVSINRFDYASDTSACTVFHVSIKRHGFPIKVVRRGEDIYLVRTDKE